MFGGHNDDAAKDDAVVAAPAGTVDVAVDSAPMVATPAAPVADNEYAGGSAQSDATVAPMPSTSGAPTVAAPVDDDLLHIKQQALQQLSPLIGHLDQSPEDRFRTTMMMIQASDDQTLIKDAYAAAAQIADEKVRAQALLDIVNEINYFTQQASGTEPSNAAA